MNIVSIFFFITLISNDRINSSARRLISNRRVYDIPVERILGLSGDVTKLAEIINNIKTNEFEAKFNE